MKKIIALILALAMVFSFTACGGGSSDSGKSVIDEIKAKSSAWDGSS